MPCTAGLVLMPKDSWLVDPVTGLSQSVSFCSQHPWLEPSMFTFPFIYTKADASQKQSEKTCTQPQVLVSAVFDVCRQCSLFGSLYEPEVRLS